MLLNIIVNLGTNVFFLQRKWEVGYNGKTQIKIHHIKKSFWNQEYLFQLITLKHFNISLLFTEWLKAAERNGNSSLLKT